MKTVHSKKEHFCLKITRGAVRDRELEIVDHQTKIEDLNKQLSECESRVDNGKAAIADLHQQLRYEGKRNERMELVSLKCHGVHDFPTLCDNFPGS